MPSGLAVAMVGGVVLGYLVWRLVARYRRLFWVLPDVSSPEIALTHYTKAYVDGIITLEEYEQYADETLRLGRREAAP